MLAKRVIISLLFNEAVLFRSKKFVLDYRYTSEFSWASDCDELCIIDVTRGEYDRSIFHSLVRRYCKDSGLPMTVGGRVRSLDEAKRLFDLGADRVLIGYGGISLYEQVAKTWGSQALVAGIDYSNEGVRSSPVGLSAGIDVRDAPAVTSVVSGVGAACRGAEARGAGEILLTSIDRDGSLSGFDLSTLREVLGVVSVPVVVAGGCGSWPHFKEAFEAGAQGACTTNIFHMNATAMRACKQWLAANYDGPVRPVEAT